MRTRIVTGPRWATWWLFGAVVGASLLFSVTRNVLALPLIVGVLVVLVARSPERAALGGGALIPTGLWFLCGLRAAVERCDAMGHSPKGGCEIYGVPEQAIAIGLYTAVGLGLTAYAVLRSRTARA